MYLDEKEKHILHNSTIKECAEYCGSFEWCKSFDYNHKFEDKHFKKCWMYDKNSKDYGVKKYTG